jgi:predicted glycogen debranching enzyme
LYSSFRAEALTATLALKRHGVETKDSVRKVDGENGDDAAFRPNQILAIALEHPVLDREYWEAVVTAVHTKLGTPLGLRSLAPGEADYRLRYFGDLRARDAAYHRARCGPG